MDWTEALVLGVVQGLTEFFPVSSSGHLVLAQELMGLRVTGISFEVAVHVATLVSVLLVYRRRVLSLLRGLLRPASPKAVQGTPAAGVSDRPDAADERAWRYLGLLVLATIPAALLGVLASDWFEARFDDPAFAGTMLLVTGAVVWSSRTARTAGRGPLVELAPVIVVAIISAFAGTVVPFLAVAAVLGALMVAGRVTAPEDWTSDPKWGGAISIGLAQAVAILPGISRSGSTVVTGLWRRIEPEVAAEFSFLLSVPAILGAAVLKLPDLADGSAQVGAAALVVGAAAAAISGVLAIRLFIGLLRRKNFHVFAIYCWLAGTLFLATR